jgi:hypothetical protein
MLELKDKECSQLTEKLSYAEERLNQLVNEVEEKNLESNKLRL